MSSYSAMRLFLRWEKPGRLGTFGNVGLKYATPLVERHRQALKSQDPKSPSWTQIIEKLRILIPVRRYYSTSATAVSDINKSDAARLESKKKPKTAESPKVMLISDTKSTTVLTLEDARKLASSRALYLIKVEKDASPVKTEKPVYKMITSAEFMSQQNIEISDTDTGTGDFRSDKDTKKKEKDVKSVMMKSKIAEHDALSKIKQMNKWIEKGHPVRVVIGQAGEQGNPESVYKLIEENMKESGARFLQKIAKGGTIRFHLMAPKEPRPSAKVLKKKAEDKERESSNPE